jgi:hypothetical protein
LRSYDVRDSCEKSSRICQRIVRLKAIYTSSLFIVVFVGTGAGPELKVGVVGTGTGLAVDVVGTGTGLTVVVGPGAGTGTTVGVVGTGAGSVPVVGGGAGPEQIFPLSQHPMRPLLPKSQ